jgi:hypothetical protein
VLGFKIPAIDIFKGGYAPKGWAHREARSNGALEYLHELAEGTKNFPIWLKGVTPQDQRADQPQ